MNTFLLRLKEELDYQGITQKELAFKAGLSINTIHSWFSKDIIPPLDSAYKVAKVINQPLEYLINGDVFVPNNFHLPTREFKLLENYKKLSDVEKKAFDQAIEIIAISKNLNDSESDIF